ncbi:MAG: trypsin-like peptidase domain-containing protein [Melioribacteraceae bacterium]|nr:trypsin-like peptidase domain-containing protein [Melioribacteraceae bacterium]WKZ71030.1 MAG: trypsin-like peptidase domain-containing protein [Melioribacteraceae bacterium]
MKQIKVAFLSSFITILILSGIFAIFYYNEGFADENTQVNESDSSLVIEKASITDSISRGRETIITKTIKNVSPAVVGINVVEIREIRSPWYNFFRDDPYFRDYFRRQQRVQGLGSGVIISPDGYIVTNDHVAGNAVEVIVTMTDGMQYKAEVIGSDMVSDICLLKIDAKNLPYVPFGKSDDLLIGEWVVALGNPFGLFDINDQPTVTVGVISSTGMNLGQANNRYYVNMIQTDAAINGGNSGGPLVNSLGELIGMNTLIFTADGSRGNVGVGFAIPVEKIEKIINELKRNGKVDRDFWTGLRIQAVDEGIAKYYNLQSTRGVIVTNVSPNSPAEKADLKVGDIILRVGKYKINDDNTLIGVLQEFKTGDTFTLTIIRENKTITKTMRLEKRND